MKRTVTITACRLTTEDGKISVDIENLEGIWVRIIEYPYDGTVNISHIVEGLGMRIKMSGAGQGVGK